MATRAPGSLDFEALRQAIEGHDADALIGFYSDDAEMCTINRRTPPSSPEVLRGREEISDYLRDFCEREMTHHVENEVVGEGRIAFNEACEYPDGTRVLGANTLELRDGKIVRQINVEAWDDRFHYRRIVTEPEPFGVPGSYRCLLSGTFGRAYRSRVRSRPEEEAARGG